MNIYTLRVPFPVGEDHLAGVDRSGGRMDRGELRAPPKAEKARKEAIWGRAYNIIWKKKEKYAQTDYIDGDDGIRQDSSISNKSIFWFFGTVVINKKFSIVTSSYP